MNIPILATFDGNATKICPYSIYSLQFFLLFPLVKIGQQLNLPTILSYFLALGMPLFILDYMINHLSQSGYITLVKHSPIANHCHGTATTFGVILRSAILGIILCVGLSFIDGKLQQHFVPLGFYLVLLSSFHMSEYFVTSLTNPSTLGLGSFLIDQSAAYVIAISCSFIEYLLEVYLFRDFKKFNIISMIGLIVAISGEIIRKLAMFTAGKSFTHTISSKKKPDHVLVTHGIYSLFRHPSYAGWFYWAIGTQILLLNPFCVILFAMLSCSFFRDRILYEEETLVEFFGDEYEKYRERVGIKMPIKLK